ncbi:prolyl oligopeptidase family serine peptidase [Candidatus Beckwithbacteria bacterium]|nr:prolyl oligopeptidase family serine peptidase [Candidatus Beckwithbacteria bacterium]
MKLLVIGCAIFILVISCCGVYFLSKSNSEKSLLSPGGLNSTPQPTPKPLLTYTFTNLAKRKYQASQIKLGETVTENSAYISQLFTYQSDSYTISGIANFPVTPESKKRPVIIMIRGYVDQEMYRPGIGTEKAAAIFAQNGYITLAPDFLDYGSSDKGKDDVWFNRFHNPVDVLNLIASVGSIGMADPTKIGIWAHSNGGQIALSVLEISGKNYPTTLWAPVSKPFPYSVLYYTDEFDDEGKYLRQELAYFEQDYDVTDFSITQYFDQIQAPLQIHQGDKDEEVPVYWSNTLVDQLKGLDKDVTYFVWVGADHNMVGSWGEVVEKDVEFFDKHLQ